jgi:glyoxylase-like metal-dependent hydrolase (beta-lactamase superfamily II)
MNLAFVVGKDAVAVIETGYHEPMAREMLQHIAKITSAPVKYVINSNSQPDRFLGNEHFRRQGATVITSVAEAKRMAEMGGMFAQASERALGLKPGGIVVPKAPDRILDGDAELDLGGLTIKLKQFRAAHTPGPLVVHIPKDNAVYGGDILYSGRMLAVINGSNVKSWIEVFDKLRGFGDAIFVPGHGKPAPLSAFEFSTREYLAMLRNHMTKAVDEGKNQQDAIKALDQSRFAKLENYQDLAVRNASFAYLESEIESFK